MPSTSVSTTTIVLGLCAVAGFASVPAQARPHQDARPARVVVAANGLGDLSSFRAIATDTLALVKGRDLTAARTRVKDLETAWDNAEGTLRPRDETAWKRIDGAIDAVLTDLRTPDPDPAACAKSLRALLGMGDFTS